ncbi:MAG: hypothetical protein WKF77_16620 [Planctomycetaceae bacterium]
MKICLHLSRRLRVCFTLTLLALVSETVAADDLEMWVQRWGILDGDRLCDYDTQSGQLLISYRDGAVLWDVKSGLALRRYLPLADSSFVTHEGCILDQQILLGGTHFVSLLDKQSGQLIRSFDLEGNQLNSLATNKGSTLLAASTLQGKLYIWNLETGRQLHAIDAQQILREMEFSPDSRLLLCGSDEHVATLWDVETGELRDRLNAPTDVRHVAFSDDGRRMLTAGFGMNVRTPRVIVWDMASLVHNKSSPEPRWMLRLPGRMCESYSLQERLNCGAPIAMKILRHRRSRHRSMRANFDSLALPVIIASCVHPAILRNCH